MQQIPFWTGRVLDWARANQLFKADKSAAVREHSVARVTLPEHVPTDLRNLKT